MKIFLDTANLAEIREAATLGIVSGVTTNPSLVAKEKRELSSVIKEISTIVSGPISAEVIATDFEGMLKEARELSTIASNVVVKIPMTAEGLKTVAKLKAEGIKTNVTLIFSANQALLAARAGAAFVSPFVGRLDDIGQDGMELVQQIVAIFAIYGIETEVIAASIRHTMHVTQAAESGAHIATIPYKVIQAMIHHPLTDDGIERFLSDWQKANS